MRPSFHEELLICVCIFVHVICFMVSVFGFVYKVRIVIPTFRYLGRVNEKCLCKVLHKHFQALCRCKVVFGNPRNLEKSVGANNEKGNEYNSFLTPCLYLQNTINVENHNICGF